MTRKQIEQLGFNVDTFGNANTRVFHPSTDTEFSIDGLEKMKVCDFIDKFHWITFEFGKIYGAELKISEIKKALNINYPNEKW